MRGIFCAMFLTCFVSTSSAMEIDFARMTGSDVVVCCRDSNRSSISLYDIAENKLKGQIGEMNGVVVGIAVLGDSYLASKITVGRNGEANEVDLIRIYLYGSKKGIEEIGKNFITPMSDSKHKVAVMVKMGWSNETNRMLIMSENGELTERPISPSIFSGLAIAESPSIIFFIQRTPAIVAVKLCTFDVQKNETKALLSLPVGNDLLSVSDANNNLRLYFCVKSASEGWSDYVSPAEEKEDATLYTNDTGSTEENDLRDKWIETAERDMEESQKMEKKQWEKIHVNKCGIWRFTPSSEELINVYKFQPWGPIVVLDISGKKEKALTYNTKTNDLFLTDLRIDTAESEKKIRIANQRVSYSRSWTKPQVCFSEDGNYIVCCQPQKIEIRKTSDPTQVYREISLKMLGNPEIK